MSCNVIELIIIISRHTVDFELKLGQLQSHGLDGLADELGPDDGPSEIGLLGADVTDGATEGCLKFGTGCGVGCDEGWSKVDGDSLGIELGAPEG